MKIRLLLFGPVAEALGASATEMAVASGATAGDVLKALQESNPSLASQLATTVLAVNAAYVRPDQRLQEGDQVAIIPPVSGG